MQNENTAQNFAKPPHNIILKGRERLVVTGVIDVDSFDDKAVVAYIDQGVLTIEGKSLHIKKINLDQGELELEGFVCSMVYADNDNSGNEGFFKKLFR